VTQRKTYVKVQTPAKAASSEMEEGVGTRSEVTAERCYVDNETTSRSGIQKVVLCTTGNKLHPEAVRLGIGLLANQLLIPSQLFPLPNFLLCLIRSAPPSTNHPSAEPTQMTEMIDFSLAYGNLPPRQ
jgi:hypothetical protein